jgi:hypothetical protein
MAHSWMKNEASIDRNLVKFFIKGPYEKQATQELTQREKDELAFRAENKAQARVSEKQKKLMAVCPWVTAKCWGGLQLLAGLPPFNKPNLIDHMIENHVEWNAFVNLSDKAQEPVIPGPYASYNYAEAQRGQCHAKRAARKAAESEASESRGGAQDYDKIFAADESGDD